MTKNKLIIIVFLAISLIWAGSIQAQESINVSGGDATGSGGTFSYSIGQVVYLTDIGGTGSVAQGVQHAYEIFTYDIQEAIPDISLTVYPNPTLDFLILQISDYQVNKLSFQLFDINGKLLRNEQIIENKTLINMYGYPTAIYFVHVVNKENKKIQTFKIIKN